MKILSKILAPLCLNITMVKDVNLFFLALLVGLNNEVFPPIGYNNSGNKLIIKLLAGEINT